jgi:hypothetical protein
MISPLHLRAWVSQRQGLCGTRAESPRESLAKAGWSRSVGGANPYLAIFARTGASREAVDRLATELELFELPCARGCTYVVPRDHFSLALLAGASFGDGDLSVAKKFLGVTEEEIDRLADRTLDSLAGGPLEPAEIKNLVGDAVRNLGAEGKKGGVTTTLPLVLGRLQRRGEIRRQPVNGRLDTQKYRYERWLDNPAVGNKLSAEQIGSALARLYFEWIGAASVANFSWFSGFGAKLAKSSVASLGLEPLPDSELLISAEDMDSLRGFQPPSEPDYRLAGGIDNMFHLRRDVAPLLDPPDLEQTMTGERGTVELRGVQDLTHHPILDRGRLVGFWDYDPEAQIVRWKSFGEPNGELRAKVAEMEDFVRDQLGDARSFSLDSPKSRKKRLAALPLAL